MNTFLDIETIPQQPEEEVKAEIERTISHPSAMSKPETIKQWHNGEGKYAGVKDALIEKEYRKTSFDGGKGQIVSIAYAIENGDVHACKSNDLSRDAERATIITALESIDTLTRGRPPYLIGHYIGGFDIKFLFHRCVVLGISPPFDLPFSGRHGQHFYCTQQAWAGFGGRIGQNKLCALLGIEGKPSDIDGSKVWDFAKAGKFNEIADYNIDDVVKNRMIYNRLNFIQD